MGLFSDLFQKAYDRLQQQRESIMEYQQEHRHASETQLIYRLKRITGNGSKNLLSPECVAMVNILKERGWDMESITREIRQ